MVVMTTGQKAMDEAHYKCRAVRMERDKLKADHAELLAVLEEALAAWEAKLSVWPNIKEAQRLQKVRDVVAKHKAGKEG